MDCDAETRWSIGVQDIRILRHRLAGTEAEAELLGSLSLVVRGSWVLGAIEAIRFRIDSIERAGVSMEKRRRQ